MKRSPTIVLFALLLCCVCAQPGWAYSETAQELLTALRAKIASCALTEAAPDVSADLTPEGMPLDVLVRQARGGVAAAQAELGVRVYEGRNVTKNLREARIWLRRAAQQGDARGQYQVARLMTARRRGLRQSIEGYAWSSMAALNESADEQTRAAAIELRDRLAQKMSPAKILKGRETAARLAKLIKSEEHEEPVAANRLPGGYEVGQQLMLALHRIRQGRSGSDDTQIVAQPPIETSGAVEAQPAETVAVVEAIPASDADTALMHVREMPAVQAPAPQSLSVDRTPDLESALRKYRDHMAARARARKEAAVADAVTDAAPESTASVDMEEALQRLQDFKQQREAWERTHGITPRDIPTAQEVEDRIVRQQEQGASAREETPATTEAPATTDEEINSHLKGYEIRQPQDYSIEVY